MLVEELSYWEKCRKRRSTHSNEWVTNCNTSASFVVDAYWVEYQARLVLFCLTTPVLEYCLRSSEWIQQSHSSASDVFHIFFHKQLVLYLEMMLQLTNGQWIWKSRRGVCQDLLQSGKHGLGNHSSIEMVWWCALTNEKMVIEDYFLLRGEHV